jgi:hypothetical protein
MTKKIYSIAPSFDCKLSCEGCYLTTDVTKEMRSAVKSETYFMRSIESAKAAGYTEFAITWNPFPGAFDEMKKYVLYAKSLGMDTSVTTVLQCLPEADAEFIDNIDIITISVDDMRFKNLYEFKQGHRATLHALGDKDIDLRSFVFNYNLLWTPGVFKWLYEDTATFKDVMDGITYPNTIQHLIYKPLSIYESEEWFWQNYQRVFMDYPWINIAGDGNKFIGDIALNNLMGVNNCPGEDYQMIDVDPMGFIRRCPENPDAYDGTTISKLVPFLVDGTPCQTDSCNCIRN